MNPQQLNSQQLPPQQMNPHLMSGQQHIIQNQLCSQTGLQQLGGNHLNMNPQQRCNSNPRQEPERVVCERNIFTSSDDEGEDFYDTTLRRGSIFLPSPNQSKIINYQSYMERDPDIQI
jgi:hypothetical protein